MIIVSVTFIVQYATSSLEFGFKSVCYFKKSWKPTLKFILLYNKYQPQPKDRFISKIELAISSNQSSQVHSAYVNLHLLQNLYNFSLLLFNF
jgi:hypothetical protein